MYIKSTLRTASTFLLSVAIIAAFFINPFAVSAANTYSLDLEKDSSQYLSASDSNSLSITGDITVEALVKFESLANGDTIVSKGDISGGTGRSWYLQVNQFGPNFNLSFFVDQIGTGVTFSVARGNTALTTGVWYHVAGTWTAGVGNLPVLYVNGVEDGSHDSSTLAASINDADGPTLIGTRLVSGTYNEGFDGKVDDVRIWNVVRSQSQIASGTSVELAGNESGLVAYWKLNNDGNDSTANGNTLTVTNNPAYSTDVPFVNDTTPPSVSVTSPTNGSTVSGTISLTASSTDDVTVAGVQFLVDGSDFAAENTSAPYSVSLDTTTLSNGSHTIAARARDTSNNTATSTTVNVTVNNVPPYVEVLRVRKSINESLATSTVLQNDDALKLSLKGGKSYIIDGVIFASAGNGAPDMRMSFSGAGVSTATIGYVNDGIEGILANNATSPNIPLTSTAQGIHIHGTVVTSADGDFVLKWAQNTSNVNATSVLLGSYLRAEEI